MTAIVLLSHGSPDPRSAASARLVADRVASTMDAVVVVAFLQHDGPDLTAACSTLARAGHRDVVVVPMLLTPAFHARVDVPNAVALAESTTGVSVHVSEPLGLDPALLDAAVAGLPHCPVVVSCAGTGDADVQGQVRAAAADLAGRAGVCTAVGWASQASPSVIDAVRDLEAVTGQSASVASFVLYPGVLPDRIAAAAGRRPHSPPLSESPALTEVIVSRAQRGGDRVRLLGGSCDARAQHRVRLGRAGDLDAGRHSVVAPIP